MADLLAMKVGRFNFRSLMRPQVLQVERAVKKLQTDLLRKLRHILTQSTFSKRAKAALSRAMSIKVGKNSLTIIVKHPAWKPLVEGQRKGQMSWLQKSKTPIPIITETGKLIFRTASAKSMADGRWIHPGRQPVHFVDKAKKEIRSSFKAQLERELAQQMRKALR